MHESHLNDLWKQVNASGIGDTLTGLNVVSFFFLLKYLEERSFQLGALDTTFDDILSEKCYWNTIKQMAFEDAELCCLHLRTQVCEWLCTLDPDSCLADAQQAFVRVQPNSVYRLMDAIDTLCGASLSILNAFEEVLTWAEREGAFQPKAGQIMTPMHIASFMADLVRPQSDERIIDVSCGTGNLLVTAWQHMQSTTIYDAVQLANGRMLFRQEDWRNPSILGYDYTAQLIPPSYAHLLLSGIAKPQLGCSDTLSRAFTEQREGSFDVVLGNYPIAKYFDAPDLSETLRQVGSLDSELLFLELTLHLLRDGGRAAILLPDGVLRTTATAAATLRKKLVQHHQLQAVVSLPQGIFLPASNVKSSLLLFQKGGATEQGVVFYRVLEDGYSMDAKRLEMPANNDLWDARLRIAAVTGEESPLAVPELLDPDWWEMYRAQPSQYATLQTDVRDRNPANGERVTPFTRITGFQSTEATGEHWWTVSPGEMEQRGFSLCADTYRANTAKKPLKGANTHVRLH